MSALSNWTTEELRNVAGLRDIDGYEKMSRQELENMEMEKTRPIP